MRSLLGRFHRPFARGTEEQLLMLNNLGDGSTLSLDFTTGVLDPRLTFTRTSNATFINSSGLVEWAAANMVRNSQFSSSGGAPTSWTASVSGSGAVTSASGEVTCTVTTAGRAIMYEVAIPLAQGITYSIAFDLVVVAGSPKYADLILATAGATSVGYYLNGVALPGPNPTAQGNNTASSGRVTVVFTSGSGSLIRFGPGSQGSDMTNVTVKFSRPSVSPGNFASPAYYESTNATTAYYAPRFDYDPTAIGTPRGLLIESSATNYSNYSQTFPTAPASGTGWGRLEVTANATLQTSPDGTENAIAFNETTTNAIHRISHVVTAVAGALTCSVWVKAIDSFTPRRLYMNANGLMGVGALFDIDPAVQTGASGNAVNVAGTATNRAGTWVKYPNGWYRCSIVGTYNTSATMYLQLNRAASTTATDDTYAGSTSNGLMIWGFQIEAGTGASSYIPTGASTGTRNADSCDCTSGNFSSWYTQGPGTLLVHARPFRQNFSDLASLCTSTSDPRLAIRTDNPPSAAGITLYGNNGGTLIHMKTSNSYSINNLLKTAVGLQQDNYAVVLNGGTVNSSVGLGGAFPTALNRLTIGQPAGGGSEANAWISLIKYWPTRLPNAQLQSLTT